MVRNYKRKSDRATNYTKAQLQHAVAEIQRGALNIYRAHKLYQIPKTTLFYHVNGTRGQKSQSQGRPTCISREDERKLAEGLKTMEQWGFGLSRAEVLGLVGEFVTSNKIKTPFKNNIPGDEWFSSFKQRHNLSIKKPQPVEYSRKKMTDPFVINEYFNILARTIAELNINDKPEQVWNLDETSVSHDPKKTKVVGAKGKPSSRTTSGPGRENTTVLSAVSASATKAPPLIVFKGKNVWDSWVADDDKSFPGTAYAASPNGWMESDIFFNYFKKTLIPALGPVRPILLVYDGHGTHINIALVELARANDITILKLPPHTSHLLQPLDLSVFKSVKDIWDQKLVTWQRHNAGLKIPKKQFSELIGSTWKNIEPEVIRNGFRKAGICPFNRDVVSEDKYHPESLKRWKESQQQPLMAEAEHGIDHMDEDNTIANNQTVQSVAQVVAGDQMNRASVQLEEGTSTSTSFEALLLNTMKQTSNATPSVKKRKKVAAGAEVITANEVLSRLAKDKEEKDKKETKKRGKEATKIPKMTKKRQQQTFSSSSSEEEMVEPEFIDTDDDLDPEVFENDESETDINEIAVGRWVIIQYNSKKSTRHYIGQIKSRAGCEWNVGFLKHTKNNSFTWPQIEDTDVIMDENIIRVLPEPIKDRRGHIIFNTQFDGLFL
ncbi:hypothetical protein MTP99_005835 [Tenebrio molitor]|jgi:hypothetical protein|uniref:uncharacterized protein n=1 Tax=Tenebrio molitor TaxID=7067 RepID=UPI002704F505|nr:hypothetical protein MTP99_005835 [Tenebrio molitor]